MKEVMPKMASAPSGTIRNKSELDPTVNERWRCKSKRLASVF